MKRVVPPIAARTIEHCGPLACRFYNIGRYDNGLPMCTKAMRSFTFSESIVENFPTWCPLEEVKAVNQPPLTLDPKALEAAARDAYDAQAQQVVAFGAAHNVDTSAVRTWNNLCEQERQRWREQMSAPIQAYLRALL